MRMYGFTFSQNTVKSLRGALLMCAAAPAALAQTLIEPVQVAPQVWMVQGASAQGTAANRNFSSNATFVITTEGVVVVDALGSPALAQELIKAITRITPQPIRQVIVTHYHADHVYGLQAFKAVGALVTAHHSGQAYPGSEAAAQRLAASRDELAPWINAQTQVVAADRWLQGPQRFTWGDTEFLLQPVGPAHTAEDLVVLLPREGVLIAGDIVFRGRIPFVGQADSARWIDALDKLLAFQPRIIIPGHGPASTNARADLQLTRDYLVFLRQAMGTAARQLEPFDEAYAKTDWSRFEALPLFRAVNRMNAYNTYLLMEQQAEQPMHKNTEATQP